MNKMFKSVDQSFIDVDICIDSSEMFQFQKKWKNETSIIFHSRQKLFDWKERKKKNKNPTEDKQIDTV